ncbi:LLM class flavin-dependent oxidoreductase [Streptomyces sp. N2-109]|uniref:LLM class flavin-dependent oxidoreductase n=1 Tax=Streptomyces gossypii TaxID=2883101 RepID=A0ABT2JRR8_9ACTN|nr:LLM class flavin-dependent oxidoreductase [Streptomyces gossypii]MCT2590521.1 LLM class flavin-dependent oxidoreductase [Streptomyces gossypii]
MITLGLALPHYDGFFPDPSITGPARTRAALAYAQRAEAAGFHQLWVSDHLWLDPGDGRRRHTPDCWALLAALAASTHTIRLGSLVTPVPLRVPALLAHQVATVSDVAGPRLDVGLGAGWHATEFADAKRPFPPAAARLAAVEEAASTLRTRLGPSAPPLWIGGKRSGILALTARVADGWNMAWDPTPETFSQRHKTLLATAERHRTPGGLPPRSSVGLTTVLGADEEDLRRRWLRLRRWVPAGHLDTISFEHWRRRGLIGTPEQIRARLATWEQLGVDHIVCALGIPFGLFDDDQIELLAAAVQQSDRSPLPQAPSEEEVE